MQDQAALLKRAIIQGVSERYERELCACQAQVRCSDAHMEKMSEILGVDVRSINKRSTRKVVIAALLLAAALAIGSLTVYANREKIRDLFIQIFEEYISLEFSGEQPPAHITEFYEIGYLPPNYILSVKEISSTGTYYVWTNESDQSITFCQTLLNTDIRCDADVADIRIINHGDLEIHLIQYDNVSYYVWNDGKYVMDIYDQSDLAIDEIMKIIDGIKK